MSGVTLEQGGTQLASNCKRVASPLSEQETGLSKLLSKMRVTPNRGTPSNHLLHCTSDQTQTTHVDAGADADVDASADADQVAYADLDVDVDVHPFHCIRKLHLKTSPSRFLKSYRNMILDYYGNFSSYAAQLLITIISYSVESWDRQ